MLTIDGLTVRLGGRTILDRASAARRCASRPSRSSAPIERSDGGRWTTSQSLLSLRNEAA